MTPPHKNGCHNRPPLGRTFPVQDGWKYGQDADGEPTRTPVIKQQEHRMTTDCQYSILTTDDPGCDGCKWKQTP